MRVESAVMPLIFVPTPLGNLRDITMRAVDALRESALIVAEDTRVARKLIGALGIAPREIVRCDEHADAEIIGGIIERAKTEQVAITVDAGTPGISDPGSALVRAAREACVTIEVLPGPSALIVAAVLSGFELRRFSFEGFVPRSGKARRDILSESLASGRTSVWYESPFRIVDTLEDLAFLAPNAQMFLARELTKIYEQHVLGTPAEVNAALEKPVRGEIVFVLAAQSAPVAREEPIPEATIELEIDAALATGRPPAQIAKELAARGFGVRRKLYAKVASRKAEMEV
jgi:16S rRNA (cytidine1402-2'-O)-methyltransferase